MSELKMQADVFKRRAKGDETVYYDRGKDRDRVAGLALRVRPTSRAWCFYCRWAGKQHRLTIGDATTMTLEQAREQARHWHAVIRDGKTRSRSSGPRKPSGTPGRRCSRAS